MTRMLYRFCIVLSLLSVTASAAEIQFTVKLPTPREHYKTYNVQAAGLKLMGEVMKDLDPATQQKVMALMQAGGKPANLPHLQPDQIIKVIKEHGLLKYKPQAMEVFLHSSQVLDVIPEQYRETIEPIVHDALLAFIDGLPLERMLDRVEAMVEAKDASRGEKILILVSKIPTLQKMGQIIGHFSAIPPDIQKALQSLEMGISTITRDEMVAYITQEVGEERLKQSDFQFADEVFAEASVGAVIRGSFVRPPGTPRRDFICKIVKPYVLVNLPQEMDIIDALIVLADQNADFYHVQGFDLKDFFSGIKAQLEKEIKITEEQRNFRTAAEFYRGNKHVKVPELLFTTDHITVMDFLKTQKLVDSFPGDEKATAILADRLVDVMSFQAIFSKPPVSVFHGDPHGGNVMRLTDDPKDPYRLALLDWGLMGEFPREQRMQLVHLTLGLQAKNKKEMMKNVGGLIQGGLPEDPKDLAKIDNLVSQTLEKGGASFQIYSELLTELLKNGFVLDAEMALFIKSQVTIAGILKTLDPTLDQDELIQKKVTSLVKKEMPKRILLWPAFTYKGYRSMLSNNDVCRQVF